MDLQELVRAFNALPRSSKTPSGLVDNHWQFAIRHVSFEPAGDLLHFTNPGSHFTHAEGPAQILVHKSAAERADIILPMLLKTFTSSMTKSVGDPRATPYAPWSWGTDDEELARVLGERLKSAGVREELCVVNAGDEESIKAEKETWLGLFEKLKELSAPRCKKCQGPPLNGATKLLLCGGCKDVGYCSKECQKADWRTHKVICKLPAHQYWQIVAPNHPKAKELAAEIGLKVGSGGLIAPIRRLVITGKDTPENIAKFVGHNDKEQVKKTQQDVRMEVLLRAPPGSPNWAMAKNLKLDENCPAWTPRPASTEEEAELKKIRDIQEIITRHMGSRSMSSITSKDTQDVLVQNFGSGWAEALPTYQSAINAMDQGVRA